MVSSGYCVHSQIFVDSDAGVCNLRFMTTVTREQINDMLRTRQGDRSLRKFAESLGMSVAYLSDILRGNREPGPRILRLLKLRKCKTVTVIYEKL